MPCLLFLSFRFSLPQLLLSRPATSLLLQPPPSSLPPPTSPPPSSLLPPSVPPRGGAGVLQRKTAGVDRQKAGENAMVRRRRNEGGHTHTHTHTHCGLRERTTATTVLTRGSAPAPPGCSRSGGERLRRGHTRAWLAERQARGEAPRVVAHGTRVCSHTAHAPPACLPASARAPRCAARARGKRGAGGGFTQPRTEHKEREQLDRAQEA
eukprot:1633504-Rhodomonas_salina.2